MKRKFIFRIAILMLCVFCVVFVCSCGESNPNVPPNSGIVTPDDKTPPNKDPNDGITNEDKNSEKDENKKPDDVEKDPENKEPATTDPPEVEPQPGEGDTTSEPTDPDDKKDPSNDPEPPKSDDEQQPSDDDNKTETPNDPDDNKPSEPVNPTPESPNENKEDNKEEPKEDEPKEEEPPLPTQNALSDELNATMWIGGDTRYRFNEDGTVELFTIGKYGNIKTATADFKWKFDELLLYFYDEAQSELVTIENAPVDKVISRLFKCELTRSNAVIKSATLIKERNDYSQIEILFENEVFLIGTTYAVYADEEAKIAANAGSEKFYIYPSDIHEVIISFGESDFDNIVLHSYLGDNYITKANLKLPELDENLFVGWSYNEKIYTSITDIMFEYSDLEEIVLVAVEKEEEPPARIPDPIEGTYTYTSKKLGNFTIVFDEKYMTITSEDGEAVSYIYEWSNVEGQEEEENKKYYVYENGTQLSGELTVTIGNAEDGTMQVEKITVNIKDIKKNLIGSSIGTCELTRKEDE